MSSILETFYILFETDAKDVKKGAEEAKVATDKLNQSLSKTDKTADKVGEGFKNLIRSAVAAGVAIFSVGAFVSGIKHAADFAYNLSTLSYALDLNIEEMSAWTGVVEQFGGSAESFIDTVTRMTGELQAFATTGHSRAEPFFKKLGIAMKDANGHARQFTDLLPELADKFSKMSKTESFGFGKKLGLDQATIMILQQGRREVDLMIRRQRELGVVTQEDADIAAEFKGAQIGLNQAFEHFYTKINSTLLPVLTKLYEKGEKIVAFFTRHRPLITGALIAIGIAAGFAALGMWSFLAPILIAWGPVIALAAAFALLYDDLVVFYQGGDSLIGRWIKKWPILGDIIKLVEKAVKDVGEKLPLMAQIISDAIQLVWDTMFGNLGKIASSVKQVWDTVKSILGTGAIDMDFNSKIETYRGQSLGILSKGPTASQLASGTFASGARNNTKNTNVDIGQVTINTQATDPYAIANEFNKGLKEQISQGIASFDDGRYV
jgi:hypothetical protein